MKVAFALIAALAIVISAVAWIAPSPAQAQDTEVTSEATTQADKTDAGSDTTGQAAQEAVADSAAEQPTTTEQQKAASQEPATADSAGTDAQTTAPEEPAAENPGAEEDRNPIQFDSEPHNEIMSQLAGQTRRRSTRAVAPSNDPRYTCGLSIALIVDTSSSTAPFQANERAAIKAAIDNLAGTGSQLGVIKFARYATEVLPKSTLQSPSDVTSAKAKIDGMTWISSGQTDQDGSNYAAALELAAQGNYNAVILVSDGQINRTKDEYAAAGAITSDYDIETAIAAAQKVKDTGASIFGIRVLGGKDVTVRNTKDRPSGAPAVNWWFADSDPLPTYMARAARDAKLQSDGPNNWLSSWKYFDQRDKTLKDVWTTDKVSGTVGSRTVTASFGQAGPLYTMRTLNGPAFMATWTDAHSDVQSDLSDLKTAIDRLTSGCWGTVNLQKQIVNSKGEVQSGQALDGFKFVADNALNGSTVQSNYTVATDGDGKAELHYPTTAGVGSMKVTEDLANSTHSGYKLREQTLNGAKTVAICTAVDKSGQPVSVSYGSGSGIVVTSDAANNAFSISGVGTQHRVNCTVQNYKGEPDFVIKKTPLSTNPLDQPIFEVSSSRESTVKYVVTVTNNGTGPGKPTVVDTPMMPGPDAYRTILSIQDVVFTNDGLPAGKKGILATSPVSRNGAGPWTLNPDSFNELKPGESASMVVSVKYSFQEAVKSNPQDYFLKCAAKDTNVGGGGIRNPKPGFRNAATVSPSTSDTENSSEACVDGRVAESYVQKNIGDDSADEKEQAATLMDDAQVIPITLLISGSVPLTQFVIEDELLNPDDPSESLGMVNLSAPEHKFSCENASFRADENRMVVTPNTPIDVRGDQRCTWVLPKSKATEQGIYSLDRATVQSTFQRSSTPGDVGTTSASNDAWALIYPVAVGELPKSGSHGHTPYLALGGFIGLVGAFWAYRRRA